MFYTIINSLVYNSLDIYSKEERLKKILIVDDLKPFVEQQKSILSRSDVHMFTATSGPEALSTHRNVKAALMVTDLDMPGMAGDELCSIIRKDPDPRFVSILIVTRPREADIARCKNVELLEQSKDLQKRPVSME